MSYICDKCGKPSQKGERCTYVPTSYRKAEYTNIVLQKKGEKKKRFVYDVKKVAAETEHGWELKQTKETKGQEIVNEIKVCPRCVNEEA